MAAVEPGENQVQGGRGSGSERRTLFEDFETSLQISFLDIGVSFSFESSPDNLADTAVDEGSPSRPQAVSCSWRVGSLEAVWFHHLNSFEAGFKNCDLDSAHLDCCHFELCSEKKTICICLTFSVLSALRRTIVHQQMFQLSLKGKSATNLFLVGNSDSE